MGRSNYDGNGRPMHINKTQQDRMPVKLRPRVKSAVRRGSKLPVVKKEEK